MDTNLYFLRESNDLYQKDIAKILGVHRRTYSSWETGVKIIPLKHLNKICNYYKVSMDYVFKLKSNIKYSMIQNIDNLNKKDIGLRIKQIRKENNLTMRDLASILNTTSSTISAYENGKTLILTAFAYQICLKYNVSMDWLCGRTD